MKERPVADAVLAGRRFLARRPVVVVAVLFLGAVAATLAYVQGLQRSSSRWSWRKGIGRKRSGLQTMWPSWKQVCPN